MISFIETILGTVLSSFVIVIIATFMALLVDFLFPSFTKWTRMILIFIVIAVVLQPAFEHLALIRDIAHSISMMFIAIYPILTASMIAAGGAFSMLNFQPAMLLFANGAVVLTESVLIPLLTAALILDLVTRILPAVSVYKNGGFDSDDPSWFGFGHCCCLFHLYHCGRHDVLGTYQDLQASRLKN